MAENPRAMTKMMIDMGIRPSGDVDGDFVSMMTPHHQGAIQMAQAELRYGHNEGIRRPRVRRPALMRRPRRNARLECQASSLCRRDFPGCRNPGRRGRRSAVP